MDEIKIDLLTREEINDCLKKQKLDTCTEETDLAILTGSESANYMICQYMIKDPNEKGHMLSVDSYSSCYNRENRKNRQLQIRPVLRLSKNLYEKITIKMQKGFDELYVVNFGNYPQYAPHRKKQIEIEKAYESGSLKRTGNTYTFDGVSCKNNDESFYPIQYKEYEYRGDKYIQIKANIKHESVFLKNKIEVLKEGYIWLKVAPIVWFVDEKNMSLISRKCLLSGIRFNDNEYYGNFEETEIYSYLNYYMLRDMLQNDLFKIEQSCIPKTEINDDMLKVLESQIDKDNLSKEELELLDEALRELKSEINIKRRKIRNV